MDALYQKPKKQRRHEQNGIEKIEEEPEVRGGRGRVEDNGDRHKAQCGNPMTTGTRKAPEGTPAAAAEATTRQQRLAPLAEQVEGAKLIETYPVGREAIFCLIPPLSTVPPYVIRLMPDPPPPSNFSECV